MSRHVWLALFSLATITASAADPLERRADDSIRKQDQDQNRKLAPAQNFVLGNTELRLDNSKKASSGPVLQPANDPSQATVSLRQPIHENAALNYSNEFGSQKAGGLPFSSTENLYTIDRKEIWSVDFSRSAWNGRAYAESQSRGENIDMLSSGDSAHGVKGGTQFSTGTDLSAELRREQFQTDSTVAERDIYQTRISQKLGSLPLTYELVPGLENEYDPNGREFSQATRLGNALGWQATDKTRVTVGSGLNSRDYPDASRENFISYYSQIETRVQKDFTFTLRSDFQDLTRENAGAPLYEEQKLNVQIGPRLRLPENFTAALDMRYGFTQDNVQGSNRQPEQALAISIQGKF